VLLADPVCCRQQLVDRTFAEHEQARGVIASLVHRGERIDDAPTDPPGQRHPDGRDVPARDRIDAAAVDQSADLFGNHRRRPPGVDLHQFDLLAGDSGAGVQLLDRELSARQAGGTVETGGPLQRDDEGDGHDVTGPRIEKLHEHLRTTGRSEPPV
jgi:hypothetical protein